MRTTLSPPLLRARVLLSLAALATLAACDPARDVSAPATAPLSPAKPDHVVTSAAVVDIGTLGGSFSFAEGMNDVGQVVGYSRTASSNQYGFLWTPGVGMQNIGTVPGGYSSLAYAVNHAGQVAGSVLSVAFGEHAMRWSSSGGIQDLGTLGGSSSRAFAINSAGQVVGYAYTSGDAAVHPFLWTAGVMQDLGTLPGGMQTDAKGINDAGQVTGSAYTPAGYRAYIWSASTGMQDLGTLGGSESYANAINASGQVVGRSTTSAGEMHAFLWTAADGMRDLGTPGFTSNARAINNAGQVVGDVTPASSFYSHAFLWTPSDGMEDLFATTGMDGAFGVNDALQVVDRQSIATVASRALGSDVTPPVIGHVVTGTAGANGWYTSAVTVHWTVTDAESAIASSTGCDDATLSTNTPPVTLTCTASSAGGEASDQVVVAVDRTLPTVSGAVVSGTLGANGWYTSDVGIAWTISPAGPSGITPSPDCANVSLAADSPSYTFTCTATTGAGVHSNAGALTVKRDATRPTVAYLGNAGTYTVDQTVNITCATADNLSGVASTSCAPISGPAWSFPLGVNVYTSTATDHAGNVSLAATAQFTIAATPASVCTLVTRWTSNAGVANSLCVKLREGSYAAFRNEVAAQSGKKIPEDKAAALLKMVSGM